MGGQAGMQAMWIGYGLTVVVSWGAGGVPAAQRHHSSREGPRYDARDRRRHRVPAVFLRSLVPMSPLPAHGLAAGSRP
jgi:hypothetical protein